MKYRGPKGTYDVYPGGREPHEKPELWAWAERVARDFFHRYNYVEVRLPIFEEEVLYVRSVGGTSDIVRKEMFIFRDKGGRELALRPEGTAGVVRAYVEHGLYKLAQPLKMWYLGPMFRHERQQKGRYRQHVQVGAEVLGSADPLVDVEIIALLYEFHQALGVKDEVVYLNNLGDVETRWRYIPELRAFLQKNVSELDPDSKARLKTNPLRTFDSKDKNTQALLTEAPLIGDFLSEESRAHFGAVKEGLKVLGVPYVVDERLVRGLDYYTLTVFEAKSAALGAQDTIGAGGRYNGLVEELGGPDLPGIGFGTGIERILLAASAPEKGPRLDAFFVALGSESRLPAFTLVAALRAHGFSCDLDYMHRSAKGQFKQADRAGARFALVLGEEELAAGVCSLHDMTSGEQRTVTIVDGPEELLRALRS
ncbi:MAG: histidine--tRNA ligase [Rubrobacter sp.]|nr:histidine--tRNA ligase [Rubrobacter sp.]